VNDAEAVAFLQWVMPRLGLRWAGFRRVRGQVVKRLRRRLAALGLPDAAAYRDRLEVDPTEWQVVRGLCAVTISRFYRDRAVWDALAGEVLSVAADDAAAAGDRELRCWSLGAASGEEPYTLAIVWKLAVAQRHPGIRLRVLATDVGDRVLSRAQAAEYAWATLRDLPAGWVDQAFERRGGVFRLRDNFREDVELRCEDVRSHLPEGTFRVILCRNLVCTYFDEGLARRTLEGVVSRLSDAGFFVIGRQERLPPGTGLQPWDESLGIYVSRSLSAGARPRSAIAEQVAPRRDHQGIVPSTQPGDGSETQRVTFVDGHAGRREVLPDLRAGRGIDAKDGAGR
jgi:chemotaxis protein methyltransferase CheR